MKINQINFEINKTKDLIVKRNPESNLFSLKKIEKKLTKKIFFEEAKITSSLYKSALDVKIPPKLIVEFARIYGFQIDFQRDIWRNDRFQILYEGKSQDLAMALMQNQSSDASIEVTGLSGNRISAQISQ